MKKFLAAVIAATTVLGVGASAKTIQVSIDSPDVYTDDEYIMKSTLEAAPYIENDITMVPLRFVTESLGAGVQWNDETKEVTITKGEETVVLQIGNINAIAVKGGESTTTQLLAAPVIVNDITLVPLRFISENLGAYVEYVGPSRQVLISDEAPAVVVGNSPVFGSVFRAYYLLNSDAVGYYGEETVAEMVYNTLVSSAAVAENWKMINPYTGYSEELMAEINSVSDDELATGGILKASYVKLLQIFSIEEEAVDMLMGSVNEEDILAAYDEQFVCAKHILISTVDSETGEPKADAAKIKKNAEAVLKKAKNGTDFDKLIKEYGEDPGMETNPDGYVFTKGEMVQSFEEAAFALKEDEISGLVESEYGYHIIKKMPLPEISEEIEISLRYTLANEMLSQLSKSMSVVNNKTVEELAEYMIQSSVG